MLGLMLGLGLMLVQLLLAMFFGDCQKLQGHLVLAREHAVHLLFFVIVICIAFFVAVPLHFFIASLIAFSIAVVVV